MGHPVGSLDYSFAVWADVGRYGGFHDPGGALLNGDERGNCLYFAGGPELHVRTQLRAAELDWEELGFTFNWTNVRKDPSDGGGALCFVSLEDQLLVGGREG